MDFLKRMDAAHFRIDTVCSQMQGAAMIRAAACTTWESRIKERNEAQKWQGIGLAAAKANMQLRGILGMLGHVMPDDEELPEPFALAEKAGSDEELMRMLDEMYRKAEAKAIRDKEKEDGK